MKARLFVPYGVNLRFFLRSWTKESTPIVKNLLSLSGAKTHAFMGAVACLLFFGVFSHAAEVQIPRAAQQYRTDLIRSARAVWGMDAPVAVFAAQVHTESWWRNNTVSYAGAEGLAQFMPSTAKWLPTVAPETGKPAPFNPGWALRALATYDKYLWDRVAGVNNFERMAFTLSAYNGGLGWVNRDKKLAKDKGFASDRWFGHVADVNAGRKASAIKENRSYVRLILKERQSAYEKAGWGRGIHE